ncbi:MAG: Adenylate cyclase [uncultured Chthoniobacterales bacterium]|uniref:Adenylate cyclase n=1 Tax=uncultured Chthoniobacterales bacterium TaxID=1836801 RepID=A0A6J4J5Q5_9BACT|nr:MAG: Adenylate cyclase [uncultured Chthoniobacterales bacterium]
MLAVEIAHPFVYTRAQNLLRDAISRAGRTTAANPNLIFLAIDPASFGLDELDLADAASDPTAAHALALMRNDWPWPREVHALVLERLAAAGAKAVIFDLNFPAPTEGDEPFRLALARHRDRVVVGSNIARADARQAGGGTEHTRPADNLIPHTVPMDGRVAYVNFWPDEDDVVRRALFRVTVEQMNGNDSPPPDSEEFLSLAARVLQKTGSAERVPPGRGEHIFRYTGPPRQGFRPHSVFEIFAPEYWQRNFRGGEFFRDKIVLIGAEGNWQHDLHATPFGSMPGPEVHLNVINAALQGEFIREVPQGGLWLIVIGAPLLAIGVAIAIRSPWLRLAVLLMCNAGIIGAVLLAYNYLAIYLPTLPALGQLNAIVLLSLVGDFAWERIEKTRVRRTLEKYVSSNVVHELLGSSQQFEQSLGGVIKPVAILFSDIRGYSTVSARTDPQALVGQLNEYLSAMVECVFRHGGTLDKFIGDAVMAVWGNVRSDGASADATSAVLAAIEMREELVRLNADWKRRGLTELRIGIAVNHGDVVVGNIGSPRRMEFTVIGDAVNVSWKLQELTKQVQADLIVSRSVAPLVVEHFELQRLGEFSVRGFDELFEIFAVPRPIAVPERHTLETLQVH